MLHALKPLVDAGGRTGSGVGAREGARFSKVLGVSVSRSSGGSE
jgi:hypothetical protein